MISQTAIQVRFDELSDAASRLMKTKRAPIGSRGSVPSDTLLSPHGEGVLVETSVVASLVSSDQRWTVNVSVDAQKLTNVCATLKKLGAAGQGIELSVKERELWLRFKTTRISIPTIWVKPA